VRPLRLLPADLRHHALDAPGLGASAVLQGRKLTLSTVTPIAARKLGIPVRDLLATDVPAPKWLLPGYVQEQSICILAGPPNAGKTLLMFDWCAKLVAQGKSVFIGQNEGGLSGLQQRLKRACAAANIDTPPETFTYRRNMETRLNDFAGMKRIAEQLQYYDLICLDSLASFYPGLNENDSEHMSIVAEAMKILSEYSGAAVLGNHHTTKAAWKMGEKPTLGDIRGHGSMVGRIDGAFICKPMERMGGVVRFELHVVKQRDEGYTPPQACEVQMTGDAATVTMEPLGQQYKTGTPLDHRNREMEQRVMLVLPATEEEAIGTGAIAKAARQGKTETIQAVKRLFQSRRILETSDGRFYRPKADPSDSPANVPAMKGNSASARSGYSYWGSAMRTGRNPGEDDD